MATVEEKFDMPLLYINHYLHSLLSSYTDINMAKNPNIDNYIPFVPAGITADLDAFYENLAATAGFEGTLPSVIFYDRLLRDEGQDYINDIFKMKNQPKIIKPSISDYEEYIEKYKSWIEDLNIEECKI